jgi:Transposase DDE domain
MELEKLFCEIDDFCAIFEETFKPKIIAEQRQQRQRKCQLCLSEVMTIIVYFHHSSYRNFKDFYKKNLTKYYQKEFPQLVSYNRFVELMPHSLIPLISFLNSRPCEITGLSFIDSTAIPICHPKRAKRNKVFRDLAGWGKSSVAWYFGFKLHIIINERGELLAFHVTPGNTDDRVPVPTLTDKLWGHLFGDKGYISKKLWQELWSKNIKLVTPFKKNMNNKLIELWEKLMLRKRSLIETVNDQLKNISQIVHSRHRSVKNFMVNLVAGLIAYTFQEKKPSLKLAENEATNLPALLV